jgi:hypothetical protein
MTDNNSDVPQNVAAQLAAPTQTMTVPKDAFALFNLENAGYYIPCALFEAFEQLSYDDVKEWLPKSMPMNNILWNHARAMKSGHGNEAKQSTKGLVKSKLMYCWAKKAHDRDVITGDQLEMIVGKFPSEKFPKFGVELESPSLTAIAPNAASVATTHPAATTSVYSEYAGTTVVWEEEDAVDVGIPDTGYTPIDVKCPEAVFYAKTFNIENQLGGCFTRIQEIYKIYAKESKAMIEEAGMKESFFGANW